MASLDLNRELFGLIEEVTQAHDERGAFICLLSALLRLFDMDQAAFCELSGDEVTPIFAMDRTKRILPKGHSLWLSKTLMQNALSTMDPAVHIQDTPMVGDVPPSISEFSLKNVVCVPISNKPERVIYLASQRELLRHLTDQELANLKIAAQASFLALQQHQSLLLLRQSNEDLRSQLQSRQNVFIYADPRMETLMEEATKLSKFNVSIVVTGESGVGKEVLAKKIRRLSSRKGPFVAINCANLTETLLEGELFGYHKGAFTGAVASKRGLLQEAEGGTFFFDEIGELSLNLQAKLLRVLQERVLRPLGSTKDIPLDIRVLAASQKDLREEVSKKRFREDLFYRIQEFTLFLPPLRDRKTDLELLAAHFISKYAGEFQLGSRRLSKEAMDKLLSHIWPGNVRELQSVCRTSVILSTSDVITPESIRLRSTPVQLDLQSEEISLTEGGLKELSRHFEHSLVEKLLAKPNASQTNVAKRLNISVRTLQRILSDNSELMS